MGDLNSLQRRVTVRIHPTLELLDSLKEMSKFATSAVLFAMEQKIQFTAAISNSGAFATLEMQSSMVPLDNDSNALCFPLKTWIQLLTLPILEEPSPFLKIIKPRGSHNVRCSIGDQNITLGEAQFVDYNGATFNLFPTKVKIVMVTDYFRNMIFDFASRNGYAAASVNMVITNSAIRWVTGSGDFRYSVEPQRCAVFELMAGSVLGFKLQWSWPIFHMLYLVSNRYERVVITVFDDHENQEWYLFRFIIRGRRTSSFCYFQKDIVEVELFRYQSDRSDEVELELLELFKNL